MRITSATEWLGVRPSTVRDWFPKRKNLDFVKVRRVVCVTESSHEQFVAADTVPAREGGGNGYSSGLSFQPGTPSPGSRVLETEQFTPILAESQLGEDDLPIASRR